MPQSKLHLFRYRLYTFRILLFRLLAECLVPLGFAPAGHMSTGAPKRELTAFQGCRDGLPPQCKGDPRKLKRGPSHQSKAEEREESTKKSKHDDTSRSGTPTPENYVYNKDNVSFALLKPDSSPTFGSVKILSNPRYDTCKDKPCLK